MSACAPPPKLDLSQHVLPRPHPLTAITCAYCNVVGATNRCAGCKQRTYCTRKCQKKDWKKQHKKQCKQLKEMFASSTNDSEGGGGGGAATATADRSDANEEEDEIANLCPICLDNEDRACVDGGEPAMCFSCGQSTCGACQSSIIGKCPTCRAPLYLPDMEEFKRLRKLVHDRSPGRHTPIAQSQLGVMYENGIGVKVDHDEAVKLYQLGAKAGNSHAQCYLGLMYDRGRGVKQDNVQAFKWYRLAAEQGYALGQYNIGTMYAHGSGVKQDDVEAVTWWRQSAEQGYAMAQSNLGAAYFNGLGVPINNKEGLKWLQRSAEQGDAIGTVNLDLMQEKNLIPTPSPGTAVIAILLTSAKASKYNSRTGKVVAQPFTKPGRAAVLLDGEASPISFKLKNLQIV
eukprot:gene2196-biopygen23796